MVLSCVCGFSGGRSEMVVVVWCACPCPPQLLQVRQDLLQVSELLPQVRCLYTGTRVRGGDGCQGLGAMIE